MSVYEIDALGRAVVNSNGLFELWYQGITEEGLLITKDDAIDEFNRQCILHEKPEAIIKFDDAAPLTHEERVKRWLIPDSYKELDIEALVMGLCQTSVEKIRVEHELSLYRERNLYPLLQALVYMVAEFREKKIVWGVGRGSSVASYVLFLLGVHRIDSIKYDLDIRDFLR